MNDEKCKHDQCKCPGNAQNGGFCSDACRNGQQQGGCGCGHPNCK